MALSRTLRLIMNEGDGDRITVNLNNASTTVSPQTLNTAMHQLQELTTNAYVDTHLIDTQSLNELVDNTYGGD